MKVYRKPERPEKLIKVVLRKQKVQRVIQFEDATQQQVFLALRKLINQQNIKPHRADPFTNIAITELGRYKTSFSIKGTSPDELKELILSKF